MGFKEVAAELESKKEEDIGGRHGMKRLIQIMQLQIKWLQPKWHEKVPTVLFLESLPKSSIAVAVLEGSDGTTNHAVSIVNGQWLFDSNEAFAMPVSKYTLDLCTKNTEIKDDCTSCVRIFEALVFQDLKKKSRLDQMMFDCQNHPSIYDSNNQDNH